MGRRYSAFAGTVITCIGAAVMTGAGGKNAYAMMIIGRIISGLGNSLISTAVPLYQRLVICVLGDGKANQVKSEIAPAKKRGGLVVMNHIGMVTGLAAAFWYVDGLSN